MKIASFFPNARINRSRISILGISLGTVWRKQLYRCKANVIERCSSSHSILSTIPVIVSMNNTPEPAKSGLLRDNLSRNTLSFRTWLSVSKSKVLISSERMIWLCGKKTSLCSSRSFNCISSFSSQERTWFAILKYFDRHKIESSQSVWTRDIAIECNANTSDTDGVLFCKLRLTNRLRGNKPHSPIP